MAILKHIASKSANYSAAMDYLKYQHDELSMKPLLDEKGHMMLREEFLMDGIHCNPETFDIECEMLNAQYHKNQSFDEIKSHHYIISFDPKDKDDHGLTGEQAQAIGMEYAAKNFPGHQALVCTHMDGHNGSGNIHVHIVINSLRKCDVELQDFMERPCDSRAGYKHHLTKDYLKHLQKSLMEICERENLYQVDLLSPSERKITDREYQAKRRGQRNLDKLNEQIIADGLTPRNTIFQTQKQYLRDAIDDAARTAKFPEEFQSILMDKYKIRLTESRGRYSYLHPDRNKNITGRALGTHYEKEFLLNLFAENAKAVEENRTVPKENTLNDAEPTSGTDSYDESDPITILFIKSDLRLVVDLQDCVKAQQSRAYAQKVKISNLQQMAKTIAYVQEHEYGTRENLQESFEEVTAKMHDARKELRDTESQLKALNEKIHYTGQYLANKAVYGQMLKVRNKKKFRQEHSSEISLYESAVKYLKSQYSDSRFPTMKVLKEERDRLTVQKQAQTDTWYYFRDYQKELRTVCSNVDSILGQEQAKSREHSKAHMCT
ncbi:MAG: relaxase/mobilization nuclease domain-containing protein [Lachnospiraceae bacterium]|nr:relaxase/mobilization nuclease domain-containing protein [Lachnospiraceae bacterium]